MRKHKAILKGKVWEEYWEMSAPQESLVSDGYFCDWSSGYLLERLNKSQELYYMSRTTPSKKHRVKSYEEFWGRVKRTTFRDWRKAICCRYGSRGNCGGQNSNN